MRKRISNQNILPNFSIINKYQKLNEIFVKYPEFGHIVYSGRGRSCLRYCDCFRDFFLEWRLRGTFTPIEEMLESLQIGASDFEKDSSKDRLLDYIQFLLNAVHYVSDIINTDQYAVYQNDESGLKLIEKNCLAILDYFGAELQKEKRDYFVFYKDDVATAVEKENKDIQASLVEYLKIDNRHDLTCKAEILCTIVKKIEPHRDEFKGTEFSCDCSDAEMLFNRSGIRHDKKELLKLGL